MSINPTTTQSWKKLKNLSEESIQNTSLFELEVDDFYLNYSRNKISKDVMDVLLSLAEAMNLSKKIEHMFSG